MAESENQHKKKNKKNYRNSENALAELFGVGFEEEKPNELKEIINSIDNKTTDASIQDNKNIDNNTKDTKETKRLVVGETLIGKKFGRYKGQLREIKVYYGGYVLPLINNKFLTLKQEHYDQILEEFLSSEEGKTYERPTEEERKEAQEKVKVAEENYEKKLEEEVKNEDAQIQPGKSALSLKVDESRQEEKSEKEEVKEATPTLDSEDQKFADDLRAEEAKAVEYIENKKYTKEQIKEIRKTLDSEKRMSSASRVLIIILATFIAGVLGFFVYRYIKGTYVNLELNLLSDEVTLKTGDSFIASDYVELITDDSSAYVIYPTLDTDNVGTYTVEYVATNNYKNVKKSLKVNVIDGVAPTITLTQSEIKLVRNKDEENQEVDLSSYIDKIEDNIDSDIEPSISEFSWDEDEQFITYTVTDSAGNESTVELKVVIEDKVECGKNAVYDDETNTCSCKSGYTGDAYKACSLKQSSSSSTNNSSSSSSSNSSSNNGNTSGGNTQPSPSVDNSPFISGVHPVTVSVDTDINDVIALLNSGVSSSSTYSINVFEVNTSVAGTYTVYFSGYDGASASTTVTVQ